MYNTSPALAIHTSPHRLSLLIPIAEVEYDYRGENALQEHIAANHNIYDHLRCSFCEKQFTSKAGKVLHEKYHTRDRAKQRRNERLRELKQKSEPRYYTCKECGEKFNKRKDYNQHVKIHNVGIVCLKCKLHFQDRFEFELKHAIEDGAHLADVEQNGTTHQTRSKSRSGYRGVDSCLGSIYNGDFGDYNSGYETDTGRSTKRGRTSSVVSGSSSRYSSQPRKRKKFIERWMDDMSETERETFNNNVIDPDLVNDGGNSAINVYISKARQRSRMANRSVSSMSVRSGRSVRSEGAVSPPTISSYSEPGYICSEDVCYRTFPTLVDVTLHEMREHNRLCLFKCKECRYRFTSSDHLINHKAIEHVYNVTCALCDMELIGMNAISQHVNLHKKYAAKCDVCSKTFLSQQYLQKHLKDKSRHDSYRTTKVRILVRHKYITKKFQVTEILNLSEIDANPKFISFTELFFNELNNNNSSRSNNTSSSSSSSGSRSNNYNRRNNNNNNSKIKIRPVNLPWRFCYKEKEPFDNFDYY